MERDTEKSDRTGRTMAVALLAAAALLTPVLYVLSVGPASWLNGHGYLPDEVGVVYYPLAWLAEAYGPFHDLVLWYLMLWG